MKLLNAPLSGIGWFETARTILKSGRGHVQLVGSADSHKLHMIDALGEGTEGCPLILTYSERRAREIAGELRFYDPGVAVYPARDLMFYQADINGRESTVERLKAVSRILDGERFTIVSTFDLLFGYQPPLSLLKDNIINIDKTSLVDERAMALKLSAMGYEKSYQAESPGQFSVRGGIIDIFDLTQDNPYRIELWGDEITSLRSFDAESQRSIEDLDSIRIYPATEMILNETERYEAYNKIKKDTKIQAEKFREQMNPEAAARLEKKLDEVKSELIDLGGMRNIESYLHYFYEDTVSFLDLFEKEPLIFIDEPARIDEHIAGMMKEWHESMSNRLERGYLLPKQTELLREREEVFQKLKKYSSVQLAAMPPADSFFNDEQVFEIKARTLFSYNGSISQLIGDLRALKAGGEKIVILSPSRSRAKRLAEDLCEEGVTASYTENADKELVPGEIVSFYGSVRKGFSYPECRLTVIAETDIFGAGVRSRRKKPKYTGGKKISSYSQLHVGDYVIHEEYGIGIYRGIEEAEVDRVRKDYMKIEYRDGAFLYVLATALDLIQLYADKEAKQPKLNRLGTQEWNRTKTKVKTALATVAKDLVELYAVRSSRHGFEYGPDTVWQKEFEELFPYEETEDQMNAINATKEDMESTKIMDRLICGDVGFGKTEVAIRAAFKAVQEGKQVAYLVPTTILCDQHYKTFKERMAGYPVRVDMLSRFQTGKEIKKTIADLKNGLVDIVIGTHRLLSKDVEYKDLGLLVIDEEQRFGVSHKEKIKKLRENVDVLTMTATPIPRTLHMSLVGIRDMSLLEEPPQNRLPIQTYVCEYDEEMVREAIRRELSRNGQVYYVYNRVADIQEIASKISQLVPEARVSYAHGQMEERVLEDMMSDFIAGELDVLVSTTIIETGLDIPNVNTIIVHDADRMGLSQLYQLRGRVGRSDRVAYAFLMYRRDKILKEEAEKRLMAIREFTELGSGFKIAMRDLEIRGAGTMLGKQQHGHIESVGYDLYCKMLEEALRVEKHEEIQGETVCAIDLDADAFIPPEYIANEMQKLDIYKRIAAIRSEEDKDDMYDELKDRFGSVPVKVENLLRIALMKAAAQNMYMKEVRGRAGRIRIVMDKDAPVNVLQIPVLINEYYGALKMSTVGQPEFNYTYEIEGLVEQDAMKLIEECEKLIESFKVLFIPENEDAE